MCTLWKRSLILVALLAAPALAAAAPLESGLQRGAFSAAGSFDAVAAAGATLATRRAAANEARSGALLLASLGLLGLIAVRRLRALRAR